MIYRPDNRKVSSFSGLVDKRIKFAANVLLYYNPQHTA